MENRRVQIYFQAENMKLNFLYESQKIATESKYTLKIIPKKFMKTSNLQNKFQINFIETRSTFTILGHYID